MFAEYDKTIEMNKFNPNIHRRRSVRLKGYDYSQAGLYFITICCLNNVCLFGEISVGANQHSPNPSHSTDRSHSTELTDNTNDIDLLSFNNQLPEMILNDAGKFVNDCWLKIPDHFLQAILHKHIIMPNHVHGIIELTNENDNNQMNDNNRANIDSPLRSPSKTIGSVVRGFKIGVTKWFRQNTDIEMVWQRNYYEHIIRDEQSFQRISDYIIRNPAKWVEDKFYKP